MKEEKKSKKKILLTYLILAACLLVIAAITVTVIFTVNRNPSDNLIDNDQKIDQEDPDDSDIGDDNKNPDDDKEPDKPTDSSTTYKLPVATANVSLKYDFAYDTTLDRYCVHQGMDFDGNVGDSVCAVIDGTVSKIVNDSLIGENYVVISHANGMTTTYKYIDVKSGLKVGDSVSGGDVIGTIAPASGYEMKQGDHLHFEINVNGKTADPDLYLEILEK